MTIRKHHAIPNVKTVHSRVGERPESNCWGTTAFVLGWEKRHRYVSCGAMETYLEEHAEKLSKRPFRFRIGDVAAKISVGGLEHTALYIGQGKWLHQLGYLGIVVLHRFSTMKKFYPGKLVFYRPCL